jgi:hypothetical protein
LLSPKGIELKYNSSLNYIDKREIESMEQIEQELKNID